MTAHTHTSTPPFRIGQGWDTHALVEGRPLVLGGVTIPHSKGLLGHSDADALLHAIIDAMLGAAGMGDIGGLFPDTDAAHKDADSAVLTAHAVAKLHAAGWYVGNVDCTVVAQAPKLAAHKLNMTQRIAALLQVEANCVNVKAKTAEKMGPVGEGKSIEAQAVVLITRR
jgi:2-C-methyl-D-erythritol 2,4-cyclodiphosphate synthase